MDIKYMLACIFMSMGPAKHEKVAIFQRKMSGFRMFFGFWERGSEEKSEGIKGSNTFDPNIIIMRF